MKLQYFEEVIQMNGNPNININVNSNGTTPPIPSAPVANLRTDYSLIKMILLSLITFGIYGIVQWVRMVNDVNTTCSPHDGKKTMHFILSAIVTAITFGIYYFIWGHGLYKRVGAELNRRGIAYNIGAGTFWGWCVLGTIIGIGPIIGTYSLIKAVNLLNADYNAKG